MFHLDFSLPSRYTPEKYLLIKKMYERKRSGKMTLIRETGLPNFSYNNHLLTIVQNKIFSAFSPPPDALAETIDFTPVDTSGIPAELTCLEQTQDKPIRIEDFHCILISIFPCPCSENASQEQLTHNSYRGKSSTQLVTGVSELLAQEIGAKERHLSSSHVPALQTRKPVTLLFFYSINRFVVPFALF